MSAVAVLLSIAASAAEPSTLVPQWVEPRKVHIDTWSFGQAYDPWGSDWSSTAMEQSEDGPPWSGGQW